MRAAEKHRSKSRSVRTLWAIRDFRSLCFSQVLAGLGEWLATMALLALVWEKTHSALASGVVLILRILPAAVLGSILGSLVDRFDRKHVLVWCTAGRALVYGAIPFVSGLAPVMVLAFVAEVATIAYMTARDATLPMLVPEESLPSANAFSMAASYGAMPVGSAMFALFALLGPAAVETGLATAGAMLAVATLIVGRINATAMRAAAPKSNAPRESFRAGLRALRVVYRSDAVLRRVALGGLAGATGGGAVITLGHSYVQGTLHAGAASFGMLITAFCAGIGAGVMAMQRGRRILQQLFHAGLAAMGGILILMALVPSMPVGVIMAFVFGASFVLTFLGGITILQDRIEESLRGRAFGLAHSSLRVAAVLMGVAAAWGARAIGTDIRSMGIFAVNGTQLMLGLAGVLLASVAVVMLRPAVSPAAS